MSNNLLDNLLAKQVDLVALGNRVSRIRESKGLSQDQLAEIMEVKREQVSYVENGKREPRATLLFWLAKALDVSADWLLGLSDEDES